MVTDQPECWQLNLEAPWRDLGDKSILEAIRIFEAYLPRGERLRWADTTPSISERGPLRRVWSKRRMLASASAAVDQYGTRICAFKTGGEKEPHAYLWIQSKEGISHVRPALEISATGTFQPLLPAAKLRELIARMGTAIGAHSGKVEVFWPNQLTTDEPYSRRRGWMGCPWPPSEGLPMLFGHVSEAEGGPPRGGSIKWINYWCREVCEVMGFPPADRGACFDAWPLGDGGWVWQLTEDPIDWRRRDHRMQYRRALLAMPLYGNRDPRWAKPPPRQTGGNFMELHLACPPRGPGSEDDRPLRLVEAVERLYHDDIGAGDTPPFPFEFLYDGGEMDRISPKPPNRSNDPIYDRPAWLALPHEGDIPTLSTAAGPASQRIQGRHFDHPPPGYLYVRIFLQTWFPRSPTLATRKPDVLLETCARVMNAYWGRAILTPSREITDWQVDAGDPRDVHPEGLPILRPPWEMPDVFTPAALGQVNYWSAETCRRVGFPPGGDPEVMAYAREVEGCGWLWGVLRETLWLRGPNPDPLWLERNARHREILRRAYERFPAVGGRSGR